MNQLKEKIRKLEMELWKRAQNRDSKAYLEIVSENAVMVCGGFRCTGKEYAGIISEFDVASYNVRVSVRILAFNNNVVHVVKQIS